MDSFNLGPERSLNGDDVPHNLDLRSGLRVVRFTFLLVISQLQSLSHAVLIQLRISGGCSSVLHNSFLGESEVHQWLSDFRNPVGRDRLFELRGKFLRQLADRLRTLLTKVDD